MLRGPGAKLHDPCGAVSPGPLHSRPQEDRREIVACRASSRGLQIAERSRGRRRLRVACEEVSEIRAEIEPTHPGCTFHGLQKLDWEQIAASKPAVDHRLTLVDQTPESRL